MSREFDGIEVRVTGALTRLAEGYVPDGEVSGLRTGRRQRGWLAAAAAVVAVVAGLVALVALRDDVERIDAPITVPTTTAEPQPAVVPTTVPTPPSNDDLVAVVDPALGLGTPTTEGEIDRFLEPFPQETTRYAVRRDANGNMHASIAWAIWPDQTIHGYEDGTDVALPGGPVAKRVEPLGIDAVSFAVPAQIGVFSAMAPSAAEPELAEWFAAVTALGVPIDVDAVSPPVGFELLPIASSTTSVVYLRSDGSGQPATVTTARYPAPVTVRELATAESPGVTVEEVGDLGALLATLPGGHRFALWQPRKDVIVTIAADGSDLTDAVAGLRLTKVGDADLTAVATSIPIGPAGPTIESELDRIVLGETAVGRFAFVESVGRAGSTCRGWFHARFGGTSHCDETSTTAPDVIGGDPYVNCGSGYAIEHGGYVYAIVIGRDDAAFVFLQEEQALVPTIERGIALDGTPFVAAWIIDPTVTADALFVGSVAVDDVPC